VPLTKDDIDAVSMMLHVDGELAFSILLTRGGLTQRFGSSDAFDPSAIMVKGRTDHCFEDVMTTLPEALLEGGGEVEDGGREGPRHDWRFELGGGMETLTWVVGYHQGSASLPDEFADLVVRAEGLTHAWYLTGVAEETGQPRPAPSVASAPAPRGRGAPAKEKPVSPGSGAPTRARAKAGHAVPATRERIALAVLLDLLAFSIPWSLLQWLFAGAGEGASPPGAGLVVFAILEFVLLQIARRSPGYWLLGISAELGQRPHVDSGRVTRESPVTLAVGAALCGIGVAGLTSWTVYHTAVPHFGLGFPLWLSLALTLLGSLAATLAGALVLRLDPRGVWLGGAVAALALLSAIVGWGEWGGFVDTAIAHRSASAGGPAGEPVGEGFIVGLLADLTPLLLLAVPSALLVGLGLTWRRFTREPSVAAAPVRPASR
jgi:hypothetical protein